MPIVSSIFIASFVNNIFTGLDNIVILILRWGRTTNWIFEYWLNLCNCGGRKILLLLLFLLLYLQLVYHMNNVSMIHLIAIQLKRLKPFLSMPIPSNKQIQKHIMYILSWIRHVFLFITKLNWYSRSWYVQIYQHCLFYASIKWHCFLMILCCVLNFHVG